MQEYQVNPKVVYRQIGTEAVLVPVGQSVDEVRHIYSLNQSAAFIFKCLKEGMTFEQLKESIQATYDCDDSIEDYINSTVSELKDYGILV